MKSYKPTYGISMLCLIIDIMICSIPVIIPLAIVISNNSSHDSLKVTLLLICCWLIAGAVHSLLIVLLNLLFKAVTKKKTMLSEDRVIYEEKELVLKDIKYVTLYLPKGSRTSATSQMLSLWVDDKNHIVIERPSLVLIAELRRRCRNASFEIDNLKFKIKMDILLGVIIAVVLIGILLFSN